MMPFPLRMDLATQADVNPNGGANPNKYIAQRDCEKHSMRWGERV